MLPGSEQNPQPIPATSPTPFPPSSLTEYQTILVFLQSEMRIIEDKIKQLKLDDKTRTLEYQDLVTRKKRLEMQEMALKASILEEGGVVAVQETKLSESEILEILERKGLVEVGRSKKESKMSVSELFDILEREGVVEVKEEKKDSRLSESETLARDGVLEVKGPKKSEVIELD